MEVDATRFSIIADTASASLGNLVNEAPVASDIISKFNGAFEWLAEHEAPAEEQIIFVNPAIMTAIRNSTELTRYITQGEYRSAAGIDFTVEKYNGRPIIVVPSNRFFTNVLVAENGYRPQTTSKAINYMVVSKKAVVPIRKLEHTKIYGPDMSGLAGFHGYLMNYLIWHGVVIPKNKVVGCYVSYNNSVAASTKASTLQIDTAAGAAQYAWKLRQFWTNPAGLRGYVVYKDSAFTLGGAIADVGTAGSDYKIATVGQDIAEAAGSKSYYFALVDASGKIIAVSGQTAVTQHA